MNREIENFILNKSFIAMPACLTPKEKNKGGVDEVKAVPRTGIYSINEKSGPYLGKSSR